MILNFTNPEDENVVSPYINTGTIYDIANGRFKPAIIDDKPCWALDGGLSPCLAVTGRGQTYKSTIAGSFLAHTLLNYPEAEAYIYETENNVRGPDRYSELTEINAPFDGRIEFIPSTSMSINEFYEKFKELVEIKRKNRKKFLIESPFTGAGGKRLMMWVPTIILIDSWSNVQAEKTSDLFATTDVGDSSMNTMWMAEGNVRSRIMKDLPRSAASAGIYVIMTAHTGDNGGMQQNPNIPPAKQLQFMRQSDKLKNVGSNFTLLTTAMIQTQKAKTLQDSNNQCKYPYQGSNPNELSEVTTVIQRNKNNASGSLLPFVCSQDTGISNVLTHYSILQQYNNYGLTVKGNGSHINPLLYSKADFNRKTIRQMAVEDYKFSRAMEITGQLCYIQKTWTLRLLPSKFSIQIEVLAEKLDKDQSLADRILNSQGTWPISKGQREHLSIRDILDLVFPD